MFLDPSVPHCDRVPRPSCSGSSLDRPPIQHSATASDATPQDTSAPADLTLSCRTLRAAASERRSPLGDLASLAGPKAVSLTTDDPEMIRYIEYLQRELSGVGERTRWQPDDFREQLERNRQRLERLYKSRSPEPQDAAYDVVRRLEEESVSYRARSRFDTYPQYEIFRHALIETTEAAQSIGLSLRLPVSWADSTSVGSGAHSRPSGSHHLIFAGAGTSAFCNYWAKAIAEVIVSLGQKLGRRPESADEVSKFLDENDDLLLVPLQLALRYATLGTVLGYGTLDPSSEAVHVFRIEILVAMEIFVVAHEYGHFILEESGQATTSEESSQDAQLTELKCDEIGLLISRAYGARRDNWTAYIGAGALMFFFAFALCHDARRMLSAGGCSKDPSQTHPPLDYRIGALRDLTSQSLEPREAEGVSRQIDEISLILEALGGRIAADVGTIFGAWAQQSR